MSIFVLSSCSMKMGKYSFEQDKYKKYDSDSFSFAMELVTKRTHNFDLSFEFGRTVMDTAGSLDTVSTDGAGTYYGTSAASTLSFRYISITSRWYPIGIRSVTPVIGVGYGYYDYGVTRNSKGSATACPAGTYSANCYQMNSSYRSIKTGYAPNIMFGLYVPLGGRIKHGNNQTDWMIFIEDKYHFADLEERRNIDLSGNQILFGVGMMWAER